MESQHHLYDGAVLKSTSSRPVESDEGIRCSNNFIEKEETGTRPLEIPKPAIYPHGIQLILIMAAVLMTQFLISLDQTIVATAIPRITDEFHGLDKVSWYGSAYFMTFSGTLPCWGKALVYFRIKWVFLLALFIFEVGSLICAVAPSSEVLIIGRAIAGVGCAGAGTAAFLIVAISAEPQKRAQRMGILISTYGIAAVSGPLIGGGFTTNVSWRWCFYINLPIGGLAALFTMFSFKTNMVQLEASIKEKVLQLDLVGAAVLMSGIIAFTLALQYAGQTMPWNSRVVIGLLVGCILIFVVFALWEGLQKERAMIVLRLYRNRTVWIGSTFQFLYGASYFIGLYFLPIYFQSVQGVTPSGSGVRNIPLVVGFGIASIFGGVILSKYGYTTQMMTVGSALAAVSCGLLCTLDENTTTGQLIGFQILGGVAWGICWQCTLAAAQEGQDPADLPSVTSIILLFQILGGSFGISIAQCAFNNTMIDKVLSTVPGIDASLVLSTGATEIRTTFNADQVSGVINAYIVGLRVVWALMVGFTGSAFVVGLMSNWKRLYQTEESNSGSQDIA